MNKLLLKKAINKINEKHDIAEERHMYELSIAEKSSEYIAVQKQININKLAIVKAIQNGKSTTALEKKDVQLNKQLEKLLQKLGVKKDYHYCNKCKDKGQYPDGTLCECVKIEYKKLAREHAGLNNLPEYRFIDNNIDNIPCSQQTKLSKLYKSMEKYCANFPNTPYRNIVLLGETGVGKTFLISCIANQLFDKGVDVVYLTAFQLNNILLQYHTTDAKVRNQYLDYIMECDILIIDDLGTEPILKNITIEYLYSIINNRLNKHTIITSNLNIEEIKNRYNERITSRLTDNKSLVLTLNGDDLRFNR